MAKRMGASKKTPRKMGKGSGSMRGRGMPTPRSNAGGKPGHNKSKGMY